MTVLSTDFSTWTQADWTAFQGYQQAAFAPTPEQIAAQQLAIQTAQIAQLTKWMALYSIPYTGTETDFKELYTNYITGAPSMQNCF